MVLNYNVKKTPSIFIKNQAFTLAEVLITLSIIGVVATLTIPNIIRNIQDAELKTAFKKSYSTLVNAYNQATYENGGIPYKCYYSTYFGDLGSDCTNLWTAMKSKLNVVKTYNGPKDGINYPKYLTRSQVTDEGGTNINPSCSEIGPELWTLADGSFIISYNPGFNSNYPTFSIDVNGTKKPNKYGYDIFTLNFRKLPENKYKIIIEDKACAIYEKGGKRIDEILGN